MQQTTSDGCGGEMGTAGIKRATLKGLWWAECRPALAAGKGEALRWEAPCSDLVALAGRIRPNSYMCAEIIILGRWGGHPFPAQTNPPS